MLQIFDALFIGIVLLTTLVAVHEFGHFIFARLFRVPVKCFSIGFGKALFSFSGKTEFRFSCIPFGGYIKLNEAVLNMRPFYQRLLVVFAGPLFNFILAIFAFWLMFVIGVQGMIPMIGHIKPHSLADQIGMKKGEQIVAIDNYKTLTWQAVKNAMLKRIGDQGNIAIETQQIGSIKQNTYYLPLYLWHLNPQGPDFFTELGITSQIPPIPPIVGKVIEGGPGERAGMAKGDKIFQVNGQPIHDFSELVNFLSSNHLSVLNFTVLRQHHFLNLQVYPRTQVLEKGKRTSYIGIQSEPIEIPSNMLIKERFSVFHALIPAIQQVGNVSELSLNLMFKMLAGHLSWRFVGGPIAIAEGSANSWSQGFTYFLKFIALISISLGIINLLPIPVLDGGRIVYYAAEFIIRRPLPKFVQAVGGWLSILLLMGLVTLAFVNDIMRILRF